MKQDGTCGTKVWWQFCGKYRADSKCGGDYCRHIQSRGQRRCGFVRPGDTTDDLIEKAAELNPNPSKREMDMLLSTGEQISVALCAMTLEGMGLPVVSLTGWQAGVRTNSAYGNARIKRVIDERVLTELDKRNIVIVTGFQGINKYDDITTLGRGGSDTSAVALAAALHADLCQIYTDVDGVYTADPRSVTGAMKLEEITYDEMLELASLGAQVLHNRSVELAKQYGVNLEVISSFTKQPGTKVKEVVKTMEKLHERCGKRYKDRTDCLSWSFGSAGDCVQSVLASGQEKH